MDKIIKNAKTVFSYCMGAKPSEKTLIIADENTLSIATDFERAGKELNLNIKLIVIEISEEAELPKEASDHLKEADVCLIMTTKSYTHTKSRKKANDRGCRIASMPRLNERIATETLSADFLEIGRITTTLTRMLNNADVVRVTTKLGTDISLSIVGRRGLEDSGNLAWRGAFGNLPAGEAMVAPVEGSANGLLIVDGVIGRVGMIDDPVVIEIEDSRMISIEGDAGKLNQLCIDDYAENADKICEFGIGTNNQAILMGHPLVDEKVFSTVHFGFGNNLFMGGKQDCNIHYDMIIKEPTVYLDDVCIIKDGEHLYESVVDTVK